MNKTNLTLAFFGSIAAVLLSSDEGKEFIDEYTTAGVVIGVGTVLVALRLTQSRDEWRRTVGAFAAAGAPLIVRGVVRRLIVHDEH